MLKIIPVIGNVSSVARKQPEEEEWHSMHLGLGREETCAANLELQVSPISERCLVVVVGFFCFFLNTEDQVQVCRQTFQLKKRCIEQLSTELHFNFFTGRIFKEKK